MVWMGRRGVSTRIVDSKIPVRGHPQLRGKRGHGRRQSGLDCKLSTRSGSCELRMAFPTRELSARRAVVCSRAGRMHAFQVTGTTSGPVAEAILESKIATGSAAKTEARPEFSLGAHHRTVQATRVLEVLGVLLSSGS